MKRKSLIIIVIPLLLIPIILNYTDVLASSSHVYGYVEDNSGNPLQSCLVEVYIGGYFEGDDTTDANGYYSINLGQLGGTTYVTLYFYPYRNFKDKVTGTSVRRNQDKQKDVVLKQFFALVIGGGPEKRFNDDSQGMFNTLQNFYSFDQYGHNIWYLSVGTSDDRDRAVSKANIEWAIGEIDAVSTSIDHVYVWITSHGYEDYFQTGEYWETSKMSASELDSALDDITCQVMYIFLGQCNSGTFIDYLDSETNRAIYTSCDDDEGGHATNDHSLWPWFTYRSLTSDVFGGDAEEADVNSNYCVSLDELFDWCYDEIINYYPPEHQEYDTQHPQRWIGSSIGSDTNDYIGDEEY